MALLFEHTRQGCAKCGANIEGSPITQSISASGRSRPDDVKVLQQLLNAVPAAAGGPVANLAVDGICGPKTHAAIVRYQDKTLGWHDGRVDPSGATIRNLMAFVLESPLVPHGLLDRPEMVSGRSGLEMVSGKSGLAVVEYFAVAEAYSILGTLAPSVNLLRWRLTRADKALLAFVGKHFSTGKDQAGVSDIPHLQMVLSGIGVYLDRFNAFGKLPVENVILFDPEPTDADAYTTYGGDKMSTKQADIFRIPRTTRLFKSPGQSIWLTLNFVGELSGYEKHLVLLHEFAHFVGARPPSPNIIADYSNCLQPNFLTLSRFLKLHCADSIALFILEFCVGTEAIVAMPALVLHAKHFGGFPRVGAAHELIMS